MQARKSAVPRTQAAGTQMADFRAPTLQKINEFLLVKMPNLWRFVRAA